MNVRSALIKPVKCVRTVTLYYVSRALRRSTAIFKPSKIIHTKILVSIDCFINLAILIYFEERNREAVTCLLAYYLDEQSNPYYFATSYFSGALYKKMITPLYLIYIIIIFK